MSCCSADSFTVLALRRFERVLVVHRHILATGLCVESCLPWGWVGLCEQPADVLESGVLV